MIFVWLSGGWDVSGSTYQEGQLWLCGVYTYPETWKEGRLLEYTVDVHNTSTSWSSKMTARMYGGLSQEL